MEKFGLNFKITRRQLGLGLASVIGSSLLVKYWTSDRYDSLTTIGIHLPESSYFGTPSYDVFLALSKLVTCRETLNEDVARKMYPLFLDEPWGPEHIRSTYMALRSAVLAQAAKREMPELVEGASLREAERWFVSHLLATWYLGIYNHHERPTQRITYEGALMYDALQGAIPVWFSGERTPGYWTEPPNATEVKNREP